jgi:hypothetical protein
VTQQMCEKQARWPRADDSDLCPHSLPAAPDTVRGSRFPGTARTIVSNTY